MEPIIHAAAAGLAGLTGWSEPVALLVLLGAVAAVLLVLLLLVLRALFRKRLPEAAAARTRIAVIPVQIGAGSGVYVRAFEDPNRFRALIAEAEQKSGLRFGPVTLAGWSAGCGAIRQILKDSSSYERAANALMIDGIHTGYETGKPGPLESDLEPENLDMYVNLARDAIAGRKRVMITHSEIFPGTFASTTETADYVLARLGLKRRPVAKFGPMGTQILSEVRAGKFTMIGFAGNSAPDHVDQLNSLANFLVMIQAAKQRAR